MANPFIDCITSQDPAIRNQSFTSLCQGVNSSDLINYCHELEKFRKSSNNLYDKVRASLFLYAAFRFHLQTDEAFPPGHIPNEAFQDLLERRFESAIKHFNHYLDINANATLFSGLASAYKQLAYDTLGQQVRQSVRSARGNQWMFRVGHYLDHPLRIHPALLGRTSNQGLFPILREDTPVRMDLTHSGWSDIFFLGMDYPEAARVINVSVDLGVYKRDEEIRPPISSFVRVIEEPVIRITSLDLDTAKDISSLNDLFNFGNDYLSLLKAGIIASGLIPPSFENTDQSLQKILPHVIGPGLGLELVTNVNDIPKGSRLAVSTNLLAGIISLLMRATGQTASLEGGLLESERRIIASRAILGEWLGGSGGGWQDSGGIWPGIKAIEGTLSTPSDPEYGISRGALLPRHTLLNKDSIDARCEEALTQSAVLIHGGMAQNVGPILEMVTEKYLLRDPDAWQGREKAKDIYLKIKKCLKTGDIQKLAALTNQNWDGPLKTIIPWVTNQFTETIIQKAREQFGEDFQGFLMLGGMSGGGMCMFCNPAIKADFQDGVLKILRDTKNDLQTALPFAIDPLVYDFRINSRGSYAALLSDSSALMPGKYYQLQIPNLLSDSVNTHNALRKAEFDYFTSRRASSKDADTLLRSLVSNLFQVSQSAVNDEKKIWDQESEKIKAENGFDPIQHEQLRSDIKSGRIGLARNRLPADTQIQDVADGDTVSYSSMDKYTSAGEAAIRGGKVAVFSLAAGMGTRWSQGAGVIKALNPFVCINGRHRNFLDIHLAKSRKAARIFGGGIPHIISASYLTQDAITQYLNRQGKGLNTYVSPGRTINQRLVPMVRDLHFLWEESAHGKLDEQRQKVQDMVHQALMDWAKSKGEGSDYTGNVPLQRLNPPGHWYEVPNLLKNGTLKKLLEDSPGLDTIMLHNIDTVGAGIDPALLGYHLNNGSTLTFEVIPRRVNDRGGGLARVNGQLRLLEGLAQPREEDELKLRYYNSMTTWIQIEGLLAFFGLTRADLDDEIKINAAIRAAAGKLPTYGTIKDAKYRWGQGQEDIYPVMQFEKLWSDMTSMVDLDCAFAVVPRQRGQQLKDISELDAWANDGSKAYIESLCDFG